MPTFDTPAPIDATVDVITGDIRIAASERHDTVVEVRPHDPSSEFDVRTAAQTRVEFADGKLLVKSPKPLLVYLTTRSTGVDVTVALPAGSHVKALTGQGDVRLEGAYGDCAVRTHHGDVVVHRTADLRATTLSGRITVDRIAGDAQITGSGDLELTEVTGTAKVKNLDGPSWIGHAGGDVSVNSAHGDISIDRAGPRVVARTAHGSVRLGEVARGAAVLQTASGAIEVGVRKGTSAWLDVKSSSGTVHNELTAGDGPAGGDETAEIRARTLDGDILIRRAA